MPSTRTPPIGPEGAKAPLARVKGRRATIKFAPKPTSSESLCAGVVVQTDDGQVEYLCTVDKRKMADAFGMAGVALHDIAEKLCQSLAGHWAQGRKPETWKPPFNNARVASVDAFSGRTTQEAMEMFLSRTSTLHTLLGHYQIEQQTRSTGIVDKVRSAVKRDVNAKHLVPRFNKQLTVAGEGNPLKVDFLGQRYACYFLQITRSERGLEANTERAFGKLFELEAVRRLVKKPNKSLGLLEDERPDVFELLMVGNRQDPIQRRAIYQVEALADRNEVVARIELTATDAAERVSQQERQAA